MEEMVGAGREVEEWRLKTRRKHFCRLQYPDRV
jgi:hypothetical protein